MPHAERLRSWCGRPAGLGPTLAVAGLVLVAPLWLWADPLDGYSLKNEGAAGLAVRLEPLADPFGRNRLLIDDFDYVAKSRTAAALWAHLLTPHNTHFVPLFRAWTYLWVRLAGALDRLPQALGLASYLTYTLAVVLVGHVVGRETHRPAFGLGVSAAFGVSAVLEPTVRWYAAGQAVAAGAAALAMLAALQRWRARGGVWPLVAGAVAAAAAPLLWSGGYAAGPAGFAFLWADGRPRARRAAVVPLAASAAVAATALVLAGRVIASPEHFHDRPLARAFDPWQGALSTSQGVVEILVARNLGLDTRTSPAQALVLVLLLGWVWAWTRGRPWRLNPLEAAGAVLAGLGFFLVYTARGYFAFENLRDLSWYQAVPQVGAALFAAGWWWGRPAPGHLPMRSPRGPTRGGLAGVLAVLAVALVFQTPSLRTRVVAAAPGMSASESALFPVALLQRARARYLDAEWAAWQHRFLSRLDRAEAAARLAGMGRSDLRKGLGRVVGPGMLPGPNQADGVDILALPESAGVDPGRVRSTLAPLLKPEPEPRPPWIGPDEPWPGGTKQ